MSLSANALVAAVTVIGIGLVIGVLTQIGQSVLPDGIRQLANSISPWLTVAFLVGSTVRGRRWAAVAGFVTLAMALVGYYALVWLRFGYTGSGTALVLWSVGALAGGAVFGILGWQWRNGVATTRIVAIALLAAAFMVEGIYLLLILPGPWVGAGFVVVGLIVPFVLGRSRRERVYALAGAVPGLALGALGYMALMRLEGLLLG